ncbi:hypothetical protein [Burkholderia sp. Ac-20353]|uniref:hypothetical protein n=1 Tax=Burkholderia sp. Ac-20353 TaxID=2703894 RepID=UPI00197C0D8E|nr:hypothetical protein [Burkholderia sp. Ac-20353]MBN3791867.1 hypothetical protein [Burkholderia sp. Ac-20353]
MTNFQDQQHEGQQHEGQQHEDRAAAAMNYLRHMTGEEPQMTPEAAIRFADQLSMLMRMEAA